MALLASLWIWATALSVTGFFCVLALPFALVGARSIVFRLARTWARVLTRMAGFRIEVENPDRFTRDPRALLLANHQSYIDVAALFAVIPQPCGAMAKASLFRIPLFGRIMRGVGCVPVERENRRAAMQSLQAAARHMQGGHALLVFPEGLRGKDPERLAPFKKGAFLLAKKAQTPIQPITISGAGQLMPPGQKTWLPRIRPGTIRIVVHTPIAPRDYAELDPEALQRRVRRILARPLERLAAFARTIDAR